jgi:hypothetical protein
MFTFIFGVVTILLSLGLLGGIIALARGTVEGTFSDLIAFGLISFVVAVFWIILVTGQYTL